MKLIYMFLKIIKNFIILFAILLTLENNTIAIDKIIALQEKISQRLPSWINNNMLQDYENNCHLKISNTNVDVVLQKDIHGVLIKYTISEGKLYPINPLHKASHLFDRYKDLTKVLTELTQYVKLPDVTFLVSLTDQDMYFDNIVPILAFCKDVNNKHTILIPDCDSLNIAQSNVIEDLRLYNYYYNFNDKMEKAFWRGSTTGGFYYISNYLKFPRTRLISLSLAFPEILDARFSQIVQTGDHNLIKELIKLDYIDSNRSIEEHIKYKYQIIIDGNTATWVGSWWRFLSNSLVLKQNSYWYLWYYPALKSYKHYVPFEHDCSDVIEKINWCLLNDQKAQEIVNNANKFAYENLTYVDMLFYIYNVLINYSKIENNQ